MSEILENQVEAQATEQPVAPEPPAELPDEVVNEGLCPELSTDFFEFNGRRVQVKSLKVKYQMQMAKLLQPVGATIAHELKLAAEGAERVHMDEAGNIFRVNEEVTSTALILDILSSLPDHYEVLPKIVYILCLNDGHNVTLEDIEDSDLQPDAMVSIVLMFVRKNQTIGKPVADFFTEIWPRLSKELENRLKNLVLDAKEAVSQIEKNTTSITS